MISKVTFAASIAASGSALKIETTQLAKVTKALNAISSALEKAQDGLLGVNEMYDTVCKADAYRKSLENNKWTKWAAK